MKKNSYSIIKPVLALLIFCSAIHKVSAQCTENFDAVTAPALPTGWSAVTLTDCTGSNPWITTTTTPSSAPNAAYVTAPGCVSDEVLVSRYYSITSASAQLTFRRRHELELNWDGMVLEISIGGGTFIDIISAGGSFVAGGYNNTLISSLNPIGGRPAWSGSTSSAYVTTTVNLPASANGKVVVFRWRRGTDNLVGTTGAYIDNVTMTGCSIAACAENFDGVTIPSLPFGWAAGTALGCANSNPWVTVNSAFDSSPNSAFVNDPDCISDEYFYSKLFPIISTTAQITFRRNHNLESGFDGMVLEISIGGAPFTDVLLTGCTFVTGAYSYLISNCCGNPLSNRNAWSGNSAGWATTTINLPATANGKNIVLRWRRGTDNSVSATGVYIDGLSITGSLCSPACATNLTLTPVASSLCISNSIVLTASVAGATYEWFKDGVLITGVTGNTYTAITPGIYFARTVITGCLAISNVAVIEPGSITPTLGSSGVYCSGSSVSIGMAVSQSNQQYTWRKNGVIVYGPVAGNGGPLSFVFTMDATRPGDYVVETARPGCTAVVSNTVNVRLPEITGLIADKICPNEVTVKWNRVIPESVSQNYQYHLSQSITPPASGAPTSDSAKTLVVNPSTMYYFHVRSSCDFSGFGNWATISFTTPATSFLTLSPSSGTICESEILLTASGGSGVYEWYRDNILISGNTGPTFNASTGGTYTVKSVVGGCTLVSNTSIITGNTVVPATLSGAGVYCTGALVDLQVVDTENSQEYTWKLDGVPYFNLPIGGGGGNQSLVVAMSSNTEGLWNVETTKPGCPVLISNIVFVNEASVNDLYTTLICPTQVSFQWDPVATGENYQYVVDQNSTPPANPVNPGTTSSVQATVSSLTPSTNYYIHVRAASGPDFNTFCPSWTTISFSTPPNTLPPVTSVWTGENNTSWTNAANWQCGLVPGTTTAVTISGALPNYPVVTSNVTIKSLTLLNGASVTVNTGVVITLTGL